jgi:hypothetical protein
MKAVVMKEVGGTGVMDSSIGLSPSHGRDMSWWRSPRPA